MRNKESRLEVIKMLVSSRELSKQEELMDELRRAGYDSAQATLSRDLKLLGVVKAQNENGRYVYMLPDKKAYRNVSNNHMTVTAMNRLGALGVRFSGNMAVVKTLPGHASHVAYDIDHAELEFVVGTIAGDDTVFIVMEEGSDRAEALDALGQVLPIAPLQLPPKEGEGMGSG